MGIVYGYIRVSTREQNEGRQLIAMQEFGIRKKNLIIDKQSGKDFERPGYLELIDKIGSGDVIVVKSIDRLGRNYRDITEQWRIITKEKGADIVVLDMPLLDTRAKDGDLTQTFIADLVLQILSYVAETERESIRQRQEEGIAAAKAKGVQFGRRERELPKNFRRVAIRCHTGEISARHAAEILGMPYSTFKKKFKEMDKPPVYTMKDLLAERRATYAGR